MPELVLQVATDATLEEPMWCYMKAGWEPTETPPERRQPLDYAAGFRELTGVSVGGPSLNEFSLTARMARAGAAKPSQTFKRYTEASYGFH